MKRMLASLLCATVLSMGLMSAAKADDAPSNMDAAIEKYIMEHPDVLIKSIKKYRDRDKISDSEQNRLKMSEGSPVIGNKNGDITLVEFFDYHCGYCKRFDPTIAQLVEEDKGLKVVFKELPIISDDSEIAARVSLAVYNIAPDKYFGFHMALMKTVGRFELPKIMDLARQAGIDEAELATALRSDKVTKEIEGTKQLAEDIGVSGTPVILIGKQMIPGAVDIDTLRGRIAFAREAARQGKS